MKDSVDICEEDITMSENVKAIPTFKNMNLRPEVLRGIYEFGFTKPSLVQQRAIGQIIRGRDVVVQAQSGTGKTATFCIGTLQLLDPLQKETQALFLAPTRELASQIHQVVTSLANHLSIKCMLCCGGKNASLVSKNLGQASQIIVGTPGRILDLLRNGFLKVANLRTIVIDEADEMLNQGLRSQLEQIFKSIPTAASWRDLDPVGGVMKRRVQRIVVSATWTSGCRDMLQQSLDNPVCVLVPRDELSLSGIVQYYINTGGEEWKYEALSDIFTSVCVAQTVTFANTRRKVDWLMEKLRADGFTVTAAHGDLDQVTRDHVMKEFRAGRSRILVTTDIWARGIDVLAVGLVVNYDLPQTPAVYLHRIGRSGRFGRHGLAISFVADTDDANHLSSIASAYGIAIDPAPANLADLTKLPELGETQPVPLLKTAKHPLTDSTKGQKNTAVIKPTTAGAPMSASKKRKLKLLRNRKKRQKKGAHSNNLSLPL